jgi:hypothetical protein
MQGVMQRIADAVRKQGVPLLVLSIPAPVDVCQGYSAGVVDTTKYPNYEKSRLTDEVVRIAQLVGAPCLDFFAEFSKHGQDIYLLPPDVHWNDRGQRLAADMVCARIVADRLLQK